MLNNIKNILFSILFIHLFLFGSDYSDQYVILVSFDGFRYDYAQRVDTPNFDYIEKNGIKAKSLKPVFPSFTFPNHYSIATGCYADKHGILGNEFTNSIGRYSYKNKETVQDGKWYGAEPIWVTAEKNGIKSATYFWVGSEAKIGGYYPTYYKYYESGIDPYFKVNQAIDWLKLPIKERPRLICLYFNEPDHAGHVYGQNSKEVDSQIKISDDVLGYLLESLKKLDIHQEVNIVIVSDHGMVNVSKDKVVNIDDYNIEGVFDGQGPMMSFNGQASALKDIPNVSIHLSKNNEDLHYHNPLYDFLIIADEGWMIYQDKHINKYNGNLPVKGMHGYNANSLNMHAIFYAYGPLFKNGMNIDTFELIHIYPMLCKLFEISPYKEADGNLDILESILR